MYQHNEAQKPRRHSAHEGMVGGAILVALGIAILTQHVFNFVGFGFPWQIFVIGPGIVLFGLMVLGGRSASGLAIPATIVTTIGMLLLFQGVFDYFESWAYAWALLPTAGGVGTLIAGLWSENAQMVAAGRRAAKGGLTLFVAFAAFFELFIFRHGSFTKYAWTVALILVGIFFLARGVLRLRAHERTVEAPLPPATTAGEGEVFPY
jgi:hypothetical protein